MKKNYNILNDCRGMDEEEVLETILKQRCITDPDHFFNPTEDDLLPLDSMYRIEEAAQRVIKAFRDNELIGILFDTDTDGVGSGAIIQGIIRIISRRLLIRGSSMVL